jgi:hypothetical protein
MVFGNFKKQSTPRLGESGAAHGQEKPLTHAEEFDIYS